MKSQPVLKAVDTGIPFIILLAFWILLIPDISAASIAAGMIVSAGTVYFCREILFRYSDFPPYNIKTLPSYIALLFYLPAAVVKSNIDVAITVLSPRLCIQPQFVKLSVKYRSEFNRFVHAQCITLTPGTISAGVEPGYILVHALTDNAAEGLKNSFAMKILNHIERLHYK